MTKKRLTELENKAKIIRESIIEATNNNGGHLSSNLGVVELTIAMHEVFDVNKDALIFDVGHQAYTHKLLTQRDISKIRTKDNISGFVSQNENKADIYEGGHAGVSLSLALGVAYNDLSRKVICIIGDASLTNGTNLSALNLLKQTKSRVHIIINYNGLSISKNVGTANEILENNLEFIKSFAEEFGLDFLGKIDGHNLEELVNYLEIIKEKQKSTLLIVKTTKGQGDERARNDSISYHSVVKSSYFNLACVTEVIDEMMVNENTYLITPAMGVGSGLISLFDKYKSRAIDLGISEETASLFTLGLSINKKLPILVIYSTFLQRCYDMIVHDFARNNKRIIIFMIKDGLIGEDGSSHQGYFITSAISSIPNILITSPVSQSHIRNILEETKEIQKPIFIKIPQENVFSNLEIKDIRNYYLLNAGSSNKAIVSYSAYLVNNLKELKEHTIYISTILNLVDEEVINGLIKEQKEIILYDRYSVFNGFSSCIVKFLITKRYYNYKVLTIDNTFITHASVEQQIELAGVSLNRLREILHE